LFQDLVKDEDKRLVEAEVEALFPGQ